MLTIAPWIHSILEAFNVAPQVKLRPEDSNPFGSSYSHWSMKWWQWLLGIPKQVNPAFDHNGIYAEAGQVSDEVFFLCQTIEGTERVPTRSLRMRYGSSIFMPVLNWVSVRGSDGNTDEDLQQVAKKRMNLISKLNVIINGETLRGSEIYRFQSPLFDVILPEENILDVKPGNTRFFSDGYWIFTEPIFDNIELSTLGSCSAGITRIGVNYSITIR